MLKIGKVEFYFNSNDNTFFQRGLGKKESLWFEIIKEYMRLLEKEDAENLNKFIFDFKEKYTNKKHSVADARNAPGPGLRRDRAPSRILTGAGDLHPLGARIAVRLRCHHDHLARMGHYRFPPHRFVHSGGHGTDRPERNGQPRRNRVPGRGPPARRHGLRGLRVRLVEKLCLVELDMDSIMKQLKKFVNQ